jgi:hypothetical protein
VLNNREPMPGAFFYVLDRPPKEPLTDELGTKKLDILKERLKKSNRPAKRFKTPEELGRMVREDLLRVVNVLHPIMDEHTPLAHERRLHEAFSLSRRQAYVARYENLTRLTSHIESCDQPLIVFGPSGMGKSALLAYWSRFYGQRHPDTVVVPHFIGSVTSDTSHEGLLRRIYSEIKELAQVEDPIPNSLSEMESNLTTWSRTSLRSDWCS